MFEVVLNMLLLKNKAGVGVQMWNVNIRDISFEIHYTTQHKARKFIILFNDIFVQLLWISTGSFFLVFHSRLSATFDIQIDSKMKHL